LIQYTPAYFANTQEARLAPRLAKLAPMSGPVEVSWGLSGSDANDAIIKYARTLVNGPEYTVGRIIARPYVGPDKDHFVRTANRHDFSLEPTGETDLDHLKAAGLDVIGIGK
ncbi:hypothetical protein NE613_16915, partial [Mordavella massiliensis]|nr:hypothetical protein [Mordavella massiliensis]